MTTPPDVVLADVLHNPYGSDNLNFTEGTIYPLLFDVFDPDHPGAYVPDSFFEITGPDADQFYIVDTQLIFNYEPDYENPLDQGADNTYEISVRVTDSDGDYTDKDIVLTIDDDPQDNNMGGDDQPPQFVSDPVAAVPENIDDVVYTAAVDNSGPGNAEDVTFAIVGGPDGELFSIDPVTGEVFFNQSPDFENPADAGGDNVYDITIEAFNQQSGASSQLDVVITVTDENDEAPELAPDAAVTVPENYNDVVYVAEATDADAGSSVTYAITGGADMDKLSINEHTGEVSFNQAPDFDMPVDSDGDNTYEIEIVATDDAGNESQIQSVTVTVEDLSDETPVITSTEHSAEILENAFDAVYTIEASDADASDTVTFRFADDNADAGFFMIDEFSGAIYLNMPLDHENPQDEGGDNVYELAIIASDDGGNDSEAFTLSVTILNENDNVPVFDGDGVVTVAENTSGPIHIILASDADGDALDYTVEGADAHLFAFDPNTGELSFIDPPDFEQPLDDGGDNIYDVEITASDGDYTSDALAVTIEVTDETESGAPPVITSAASASVAENTTGTVYTALADDPDSPSVTFSISGGADAGLFAIDATSGELSFLNSPDYEAPTDSDTDNIYEVEITASDGVNASDPLGVSITVTNENDNIPVMDGTLTAVAVPENNGGTIYTASASDQDGDLLQYALGGADAHLFSLDPNTGELSFLAPPDFEHPLDDGGDNIYDVEITASDSDSTSDALAVTIEVTDVTESGAPPVIASAALASVAENTTGTVYTALADDPDSPSVTFSISGGADAGLFAIDATSGELSFLASPDYETPTDAGANNVYEVEITASDGVNDSNPFAVSIAVTNENDNAPLMDAAVAAVTVPENFTGTIFTAAASDNDGDPLQYVLGGADAHLFYLNPNSGELWFLAAPDFEAPDDEGGNNTYNVEISATDGQSISASTALSIAVDNVNEGPNLINGTPGPDNLVGTDGNDIIVGLASTDILDGSLGSDTLDGGLGADTIAGGQGSDTVSYNTSSSGVIVDLDVQLTWDGSVNDVLSSVENAVGSAFNDHLWGSSGDNVLDGGSGGSDDIRGYAGNDTVSYASSGSGVIVDLAAQLTWDGSANDVLLSIENAVGSAFNDHLWGSSGDNVFDGGSGGSDDIRGYGGNDTVSYASSSTGVIVDLAAQLTWDGSANDALLSIENAIGSRFHDDIWGNSGDNVLDGGLGRDVLSGYGGNDTFVFHRGEASGDVVVDFDGLGAAAGDRLEFFGYGTAAGGATFTQLDATHWSVNSADGLVHDVISLTNGAPIHATDILFH